MNGARALALSLSLAAAACSQRSDAPPQPPVDPAALASQAQSLSSKGLFVEAANLLRSKVDQLPEARRGDVHLRAAQCFLRGGVPDSALKHADLAAAAGVESPEVLFVRGEARRQLHLAGAEEALAALIQAQPAHLAGTLALARLRFRSSDPAAALPLFERYLQSATPEDFDYRTALLEHGRALKAARRYQEAADRFVVLLEDDPLDAEVYSELAAALYRLHLRKEGEFIEMIYKALAESSFEEHVEDRLRETGATAFALGQRAVNRQRQKRYLEAFHSFRQAIEVDGKDPRLRMWYADLCIHFRRGTEAKAVLDAGLEARPALASGILWMKGRALLEEEAYAAALSAFEQSAAALEREGDQGGEERGQASPGSVYLAMTRAALEAKDSSKASAAVGRAAAAMPQSWEPVYWQGRVALTRDDAAGAQARFADAAQRYGKRQLLDIAYWSAVALGQVGRKQEAAAEMEKLLPAHPAYEPLYHSLLELSAGDRIRAAQLESGLAQLKEIQAQIDARKKAIEASPLEAAGLDYLELGKLLLRTKSSEAFDLVFLATDLLPSSAEACRVILSGLREPTDVFLRVRFLRRLLELEPSDEPALTALAGIYLKLHVRVAEAAKLAEKLESARPSAASARLRGLAALLAGDRDGALGILRSAAAKYPGDGELREALAVAEGSSSAATSRD